MRPMMAGPDSSTMKYTPTHDKGKHMAHATQSDGFRPVSGPASKTTGNTSPRSGSAANSNPNGPKKCLHCGKTVYFAEEQLYDGNVFHISCFPVWSKQKDQQALAPRNASYERPADVQPAYYRTGDAGTGPRMESGAEYKSGSQESASAPQSTDAPATGAPKFCSNCGTKRNEGAKFCGNCGTKF